MKNLRILFICIIAVLMFFPSAVSAQRLYPAAGTLESSEDGLWNYYKGKTKQTVRRNAPMFEKLNNTSLYLLDYTEIRGVKLYLSAEFRNNKLALLQITTPFPEYSSCNKETKDLARSYAEVGYSLMGVNFNAKQQCKTVKGSGSNNSTYVCTADDYACVYKLCPGDNWSLACSVVE
ncbi:MAG: hypothetical protein IKP86_07010 [Anaerolineaceae bacterium]|nr:hypothetical protein [Anaerolineaceae bacterium]